VVFEPQIEDKIVEFSFLLMKWSAVVVFTVIISKSEKYRDFREKLRENLLDILMGFPQNGIKICIIRAWVLSNTMPYQVSSQ
jgi:hypothetical protein